MSDIKKILIASAVIIIALALSFVAGQRDALNRLVLPQKERVDTLVIYETKLVEKPVFVEKKVIEKVPIPVSDTMMVHDTIYVYMDREQVHWQDSMSDVYASGYDVQVDSVRHNIQTQVTSTYEWIASIFGDSVNVSRLYIPQVNIEYGTYYLQYLYEIFDCSWEKAIIAYNWGMGNFMRFIEEHGYTEGDFGSIPVSETRNYVRKVLYHWEKYKEIYNNQ